MADEEPKGIRAEMRIGSPPDCPIAKVSGRNGTASLSVSKAESSLSSDVTEEVVFDSEMIDEAEVCGEVGDETMEGIFSYGSETVYRFSREKGRGCACERVEDFGFPVVDIHTDGGDLFLTFHVTDNETLKRVMERLGERYPDVEIRRLVRSETDGDERRDLVFIDRSELTEKQEEALRTAHEMGYFEHPKDANAGDVAEKLGVSTSTFTEHLSAAQRKILSGIVEG
mgnify:FL=1